MTSRYQWDINAQTKHAPTSAERRFAPVRALYAPGFAFVFLGGSRGSAPYGAPPPGYFIAPLRGSNLGSLALANYPTNARQLPICRAVETN